MSDYTNRPTRVRVFSEQWDGFRKFTIDGADNDGRYTESVWSGFATLAQAFNAIPAFIQWSAEDGVMWDWDPERPMSARIVNPNKVVA